MHDDLAAVIFETLLRAVLGFIFLAFRLAIFVGLVWVALKILE